jgi:hypothetical protein
MGEFGFILHGYCLRHAKQVAAATKRWEKIDWAFRTPAGCFARPQFLGTYTHFSSLSPAVVGECTQKFHHEPEFRS